MTKRIVGELNLKIILTEFFLLLCCNTCKRLCLYVWIQISTKKRLWWFCLDFVSYLFRLWEDPNVRESLSWIFKHPCGSKLIEIGTAIKFLSRWPLFFLKAAYFKIVMNRHEHTMMKKMGKGITFSWNKSTIFKM